MVGSRIAVVRAGCVSHATAVGSDVATVAQG